MLIAPCSLVTSISLSTCVLHVWYVHQFCHGMNDVGQCIQCVRMLACSRKKPVIFSKGLLSDCSAIVPWGWDMRAPHSQQKRLLLIQPCWMNFGQVVATGEANPNNKSQIFDDLGISWYMEVSWNGGITKSSMFSSIFPYKSTISTIWGIPRFRKSPFLFPFQSACEIRGSKQLSFAELFLVWRWFSRSQQIRNTYLYCLLCWLRWLACIVYIYTYIDT